MKRSARIVIALAIVAFICSCHSRDAQQKEEKVAQSTYQKIENICPGVTRKAILIYYFDGDCAMCIGKARHIEKYANDRELKPVLIAQTLNPAEFQYNLKKLNVQACVHIEVKHEFENKLSFMKVMKIDTDRAIQDYDKQIENNQ